MPLVKAAKASPHAKFYNAPNATSKYQAFVDEENDALFRVSPAESTVLKGDFNVHVGTDTDTWKGVIGKYGVTGLDEKKKNLIDFSIVLSDLFSDVLDVRVKRGAESSTDYHQVVCSLQFWKLWLSRKSNRLSVAYRIKREALEDREVRKQLASNVSNSFRQLADAFEDIEKEWQLFKSEIISSAAKCCARKRLKVVGDSEKKTPWSN